MEADNVVADLARLIDEREVANTLYRYAHAIDHRIRDEWLDCFTPDGVFEGALGTPGDSRPSEAPTGSNQLVGRDEIGQFFDARPGGVVRHVSGNVRITVSGDSAQSTSYVVRYEVVGGLPSLSIVGTYEDELERAADGQWRFRLRAFRPAAEGA